MLTYSAQDKTYRVWDMTNYDELYKLPEDDITEIKISPGIMLLILSRSPSGVRRRLPSSRSVAAPLQPSHRPLGAAARTSRAPAALSARHCRRLPRQGHVPLKILSIEDGTVLQRFNHLLHRTKKVEFIEQFNEKLLIKQEGENLHIVDVHTHAVVSVDKTEFITPSAFVFLCAREPFRTLRESPRALPLHST